MGAWIEMSDHLQTVRQNSVAPLMGAWIEILNFYFLVRIGDVSRPSWARGLKFMQLIRIFMIRQSRPSWARGLKFESENTYPWRCVAPLMGAWIEIV